MKWKIGESLEVEASDHGWPFWTRIHFNGDEVLTLNHDEAKSLADVMHRVAQRLDAEDAIDLERKIRNVAQNGG